MYTVRCIWEKLYTVFSFQENIVIFFFCPASWSPPPRQGLYRLKLEWNSGWNAFSMNCFSNFPFFAFPCFQILLSIHLRRFQKRVFFLSLTFFFSFVLFGTLFVLIDFAALILLLVAKRRLDKRTSPCVWEISGLLIRKTFVLEHLAPCWPCLSVCLSAFLP